MIRLDCASTPEPELGTVDCVARIQVAARERGEELEVVNVSPYLFELLVFCGLAEVLGLEMERHPE